MTTTRRQAAYQAAASAAAKDGPSGFVARITSIPRLVRDVLSGRYDGMSRGRLALMVLGVFYVISPIDLVPEAVLPFIGLADDTAVIAWLIASLWAATTDYRIWEGTLAADTTGDPRVVAGEVLR